MEGAYNPDDVIAGSRGTKLVTSSVSDTQFRGFEVDSDAVISVLKSTSRQEDGSYSTAADVLSAHIEGGSGTTISAGTTIMCQESYFTDVTVDSGQINLLL